MSYASGWDSWKVLDYSDSLVLAVSECDYVLDGFRLIPLSEIESLKPREPIRSEIERYYASPEKSFAVGTQVELTVYEVQYSDKRVVFTVVPVKSENKASKN